MSTDLITYDDRISHLNRVADVLRTMLAEAEIQQNTSAAADCRKQIAHIESELKRLSQERSRQQQ